MSEPKEQRKQQTDEDLMLAYQQGDSEAFNALYDRISDKLYGYLCRRVRSQELVDDIFQATMIKFHATRLQYRSPLPVMPWAFTICRTVMLDTLKQQNRRREELRDMQSEPDDQISGSNETGDASRSYEELASIRTLTETQREALSLRYEHELPFEDIAARLQTSPANARQLVSRAVKKIKSLAKARGGQ